MEKETVKKYFQRADFSAVQADALADILAEQATRSEMRELRADFRRLEEKVDERLNAFDRKLESQFSAFDRKLEDQFDAFDRKIDERFQTFNGKLDDKLEARFGTLEARLTWRLLALVTFLGTVMMLIGGYVAFVT